MTQAADADELVVWVTEQHETCTRHRSYALTCDQFDALLERSGGRCELCGADCRDSAWGLLHIDHEHQVGQWAVRGLLCDACNLRLQRGRRLPVTEPLQRYLANAWYQQELVRLGLSDEPPPEPGIGSCVTAFGRTFVRLPSNRQESYWAHRRGSNSTTKTWEQIWYTYGPLHFRIKSSRTTLPEWAKRVYRHYLRSVDYREDNAAAAQTKAILQAIVDDTLTILRTHPWCPEDREQAQALIAKLTGAWKAD